MYPLSSTVVVYLLVVLGSMAVGCQDPLKTVTQWHDAKHTKKKAILSVKSSDTTVRQGQCTYYDVDGNVATIQEYVDGKMEGESRFYYPNGQLLQRSVFHHGVRDGWDMEYFANGQLHDSILFQR